jgi:hypothetical protein
MTSRKKKGGKRTESAPADHAELLRNPVKLFTGEEIAQVMEVSNSWVVAARKAGAPFPGGRSRPEWILDWLEKHPDFSLKANRD